MIDKYSKNNLYQERWKFVFCHKYIQIIYLRENDLDNVKYPKRISQYIPNVGIGHCRNRFLNYNFLLCSLYDSEVYKEIVDKLED